MTAGLRGSSSGMPASTLPTRSAPTSAPLVKMPPPKRAKIEISEAPKRARPAIPESAAYPRPGASHAGNVVERDAKKSEADDQKPGDRARLEGRSNPAASPCAPACAVRNWRAPRRSCRYSRPHPRAPRRPRSRGRSQPRVAKRIMQDHDAGDGDGRVLPVEICASAFLDRGGDLLHPLVPASAASTCRLVTSP